MKNNWINPQKEYFEKSYYAFQINTYYEKNIDILRIVNIQNTFFHKLLLFFFPIIVDE